MAILYGIGDRSTEIANRIGDRGMEIANRIGNRSTEIANPGLPYTVNR